MHRAVSRLGPALTVIGAGLVVAGSFMPWLRSGTRTRSSYDLYAVLRRLGTLDDSVSRAGLRLWPFVPLLVTGVAVLSVFRARRVAAVGALLMSAFVLAVAVTAWRAALPSESGIAVTAAGAILMAGGGLLMIVEPLLTCYRALTTPSAGRPQEP